MSKGRYFRSRALCFALCFVLAAVLPALTGVQAKAAEIIDSGECGAEGSNVTWTIDSDGKVTISGTGEMKQYDFTNAFPWYWKYNDRITEVVVEAGITRITYSAFNGCDALTHVTLSEGLIQIDDSAFSYCPNLESVTLPPTLKSIGNYAFYKCTALKELVIPKSVETIASYSFGSCKSLQKVTIQRTGLNGLGSSAFTGCDALTQIVLPESVQTVFSGACGLSQGLIRAKISSNVLQCSGFRNCTNLKYVAVPWNCMYASSYLMKCPLEHIFLNVASDKPPAEVFTPAPPEGAQVHYYWVYWAEEEGITSYQEAEAFCREKGGFLATIDSEEENALLHDILLPVFDCESAYFGLKRLADGEDRWKWTNGDPLTYTKWANGEANNEGGDERYGMFYYKYPDGAWNDGDFTVTEQTAFICEWPVEEATKPHTPGDINGDGTVNNRDLTRLAQYLAGKNVECVEAALDVNGDGKVNNKDLTRLAQYLAGKNVELY